MSFVSDQFVSTMDSKKATNEFNYIAEQESQFHIRARRNKLLARWVAHQLNLPVDQVPDYIMEIIDADLSDGTCDNAVMAKVLKDLSGSGFHMTTQELAGLLYDFDRQARLERIPGHPLACEPRET